MIDLISKLLYCLMKYSIVNLAIHVGQDSANVNVEKLFIGLAFVFVESLLVNFATIKKKACIASWL